MINWLPIGRVNWLASINDYRDPAWYSEVKDPVTREGVMALCPLFDTKEGGRESVWRNTP